MGLMYFTIFNIYQVDKISIYWINSVD